MGYLLSKPDKWEISMTDLDNKGPAGTRKLRRMLAELRLRGYMNRIRVKHENGLFSWITEVYESPSQNPNPQTSYTKRTSAICTSAKQPDIVKTDSENTNIPSSDGIPPKPEPTKPLKANQIPEIILFREATSRYPAKASQYTVIVSVDKLRRHLLREPVKDDLLVYYREWCDRGYNPTSVKWLSEWAASGRIPERQAIKPSEPRAFAGIRQFLEEQNVQPN